MGIRFILTVALAGSLAGCASTAQKPSAVNQLQMRVAQLESQMDAQEADMAEIRSSIGDIGQHVRQVSRTTAPTRVEQAAPQAVSSGVTVQDKEGILRVPVAPQDVQKALKSAGFYKGAIDGKLGSGSQSAIKDFQAEHELVSDGIVGRKTWDRLKIYLE